MLDQNETKLRERLAICRTSRVRKVEDLTDSELSSIKDLLRRKTSKKAIGIIFSLSYKELKKISKL